MLKLERFMPHFLNYTKLVINGLVDKTSGDSKKSFTYLSIPYLVPTENINGYYDLLDFNNKSVLTVIGASDHVFNAALKGAKKIDAFDVSIYAIMFYYLKEAAIKALSYDEYMMFFFNNIYGFDKETFTKIKPYLNEQAIQFWSMIFNLENPSEIVFTNFVKLLVIYEAVRTKFRNISACMSPENFYILKRKIDSCDIRVFLSDAKSLEEIDGKYDYMFFSNIRDYEDNNAFDASISRYISKLKINGQIFAKYCYMKPTESEAAGYNVVSFPSYSQALGEASPYNHYALVIDGKTIENEDTIKKNI